MENFAPVVEFLPKLPVEETFLKMPIVLPNKREQDNIAVLIHRASMNLDYAKRLLELLSIQKQFLLRQMFI